ncbi:MAG: hypothetical protein WCJ46_03495 [bacterium]
MADEINRIPLVRDIRSPFINEHGHENNSRKKKGKEDKADFKRDLLEKEDKLLHKVETQNLPHQQIDNPLLDYVLKKSKKEEKP